MKKLPALWKPNVNFHILMLPLNIILSQFNPAINIYSSHKFSFNIILYLCLGLPSGSFCSRPWDYNCVRIQLSCWSSVQHVQSILLPLIQKLWSYQLSSFPPASCHFIFLEPRCYPQNFVLKTPPNLCYSLAMTDLEIMLKGRGWVRYKHEKFYGKSCKAW